MIFTHHVKYNEFIADIQEYARDRIHRYDYSISADPPNDEQNHEYAPTTLHGGGYDTYEVRRRAVSATDAVWGVLDSRDLNYRPNEQQYA